MVHLFHPLAGMHLGQLRAGGGQVDVPVKSCVTSVCLMMGFEGASLLTCSSSLHLCMWC